ncbi:hypothetical protein SK128_008768 [Halocaridina rubra]|uniref:CUB domain-containing protein n=1 Tax=Halocaridina rubra TaxID=373956 RepID=A0AAN8ZVL6_HALRR
MRRQTVWHLLIINLMISCVSCKVANNEHQQSLKELPLKEDEEIPKIINERYNPKNQRQELDLDELNDIERQDFELQDVNDNEDGRYVGYCKDAYILMWPGNSRKFWSYGYVYLNEPYLANCTMRYYYNTRNYPGDPFCRFGFKVTGSFESHNGPYTQCTDTDYVLLNDTDGNAQYYCGEQSTIEWATSHNDFEFHFVTKPNSPRGKGFFVVIQSFKLCGGAFNMVDNGPTGNIYTPLFPASPYPPNIACTWYFAVPSTDSKEISVRIGCDTFSLQTPFNNGTEYCLDAVTFISEVPGNIKTYCGNTLDSKNHVVIGTHADLLVTFRSDTTIQDVGFNCTYEYILYAE